MTATIPLLRIEPATRFIYPQDGRVYYVKGIDYLKEEFVLERIGKPGNAAGTLPKLEEAASIYIMDNDDEKRWTKFRCVLTDEIGQRGKFITAKWVKTATVAE